MDSDIVTIVGAGLAGAACAVALRQAGVPVRVLERGRAPGGRLASPLLHQRRTDIGAGYFTVRDEEFAALVETWNAKNLAHPWTDTFAVLAKDQPVGSASGPMRWATPGGLRSLVRSLLEGIDVQTDSPVESLPDGRVVLAMPDPQAARLAKVPDQVECEPVIAVVCGFEERLWPFEAAAFVNNNAMLTFVADDGSRRGDGAPVLVAHTTADLAREHLDKPDNAITPVTQTLRELLDVPQPAWTVAHRWTLAKPIGQHPTTFGLIENGRVGLAGDQWCSNGSPRVESAWRSGTDLGRAIAGR